MKVFNEQHQMFRAAVRSFVEKEVMPHVEEWEEACHFPIHEVFKRMGDLDAVSREFAREHSERLWKQLVRAPDEVPGLKIPIGRW